MVFKLSPEVTFWLGLGLVFCFVTWKFILEPRLNEGLPIDPPENEDPQGNKDSFF